MIIGVLKVWLYSGEPQSLKDKRRIVKSLIEKLKNKFNISVAETGALDSWNKCEIGVTCISNEASHIDSMMSSVINFIEYNGWLEITDYSTEIIHVE